MPSMSLSIRTALIILSVVVLLVKRYWDNYKANPQRLPFPPGPKGLPIVGNLHDIPKAQPWLKYASWKQLYGDMVHFHVFNQSMIVVNSKKIADDLFEKRGQIYSDRPYIAMIAMMGWDFNLGLMVYGERWRIHRKAFHEVFRPEAAVSFRPIQLSNIHALLLKLTKDPENYVIHLRTAAAAIFMSTVYGHQIAPKDDYFVRIAEQAMAMVNAAVQPGATAVNALPFLRHIPTWFPGAGFKRFALKCRELTDKMQEAPLEMVKKNMAAGTGVPSVASELLDRNANSGSKEHEEVIKRVTGVAYATGADTTTAVIEIAILAMTLFPEAQRKAQAEIDKVVGNHRLPDYGDRNSLPYCEAFYREINRWHPANPLGVQRCASENDIYNGQFIPKSAFITPNVWAMTHDERVYKRPNEFKPERYFTADGQLNDDTDILTFGFGRRICAGKYMGDAIVWAATVSLLSVFNFAKAKDELGNEVEVPEPYFIDGVVSRPHPFKCSISLRSQGARDLIEQTVPLASTI